MRSALRFTGPTILHDMTFSGYSDKERAFLDKTHSAAMITLRADGTPHAVRVGVALVDDKLWSLAAYLAACAPGTCAKPKTREDFLTAMRHEQRLIYEFEPLRLYGMY
jgi:hypothetical protein